MRETKEPEERKNEIMDAAEGLFQVKGYADTTVSDIVKSIGVAQGTFYYYFPAKEAVLQAVLERQLNALAEGAAGLLTNQALGAMAKFQLIMAGLFPDSSHGNVGTEIDRRDHTVHRHLEAKFIATFQPIIMAVVRQGVEEGVFHTRYPEEITEILIVGIEGYLHKYYPGFGNPDLYGRKMGALEELLTRALGVAEGSFRFAGQVIKEVE